MSPEEYLALERKAEIRSEYLDGEMFAMSGGSRRHNLTVTNIVRDLSSQLMEGRCEVYASDQRVRIPATGLYTYPDVVVACGDLQFEDEELDTLVPDDPQKPYDMRNVIACVVDDEEFFEVHEHFAKNIVCGFSRLDGYPVGVVGNQPAFLAGVLDIEASEKAARFVRTCDCYNIPILTFTDVPGFLPGTDQEWNGIIRHGAKLLYAFTEATVPKLTVVTRKAYGGAYDVMNSKHMLADFNFAWPTAEVAVMGPEGAVNIIHRRDIANSPTPEARREKLIDDYKARFANPYTAAERGYVDDVIIPHETRPKVIAALEALLTKRDPGPRRKHGNIPL